MRWRDDGVPIIITVIVIVAIYAVIGLVGKSDATIPRMEPLTATFTADGGENTACLFHAVHRQQLGNAMRFAKAMDADCHKYLQWV